MKKGAEISHGGSQRRYERDGQADASPSCLSHDRRDDAEKLNMAGAWPWHVVGRGGGVVRPC